MGVEDIENGAEEFKNELTVDLGFRILLIVNIYRALAMCQKLYLVQLLL